MDDPKPTATGGAFKWLCLAVAVIFLSVLGWMVNDIRLQVRRSVNTVQTAGATINQELPSIVAKSKQTTDVVAEHLPEIVTKVQQTTETLAELSQDIRQLKELAGVSSTARDKSLVAYADSALDEIQQSGGTIGLKKTFGSGLKSELPAKEWVVGARKEALILTVLAKSKAELLERLSHNKFGSDWFIQIGEAEPLTLQAWLKEHHAATKELSSTPE